MSGLEQPLTVHRGMALMLNIVVGAGVLALPGLAIKRAGDHAFLGWILCVVATVPLLSVFVILGRRYPNAGGISHFADLAFGSRGYAAGAFLLLGAVVFGLPSIALTGGHYLALALDIHPTVAAITLLGLATAIHLFPSELVSRANALLAIVIVVAVTALAVAGLIVITPDPEQSHRIVPSSWDISLSLAPFMMIFFAFTGWEMAANTSEEFKNPKRDFPIAMYMTFAIVVSLYLSIAYLSQKIALGSGFETAFGQIAFNIFGYSGMAGMVSLAAVIVLANLAGAIWAISRLLFSLSREGYLPKSVQYSFGGTPWIAVLATSFSLIVVLSANAGGIVELDAMLSLAGQNFLILYGLASCALVRLSQSWIEKAAGAVGAALIAVLVSLQGTVAIYPVAILGLAFAAAAIKGRPDAKKHQPVV